MIEKLKNAEKRYLEIEAKLGEPEIIASPTEYTKLMRDYKGMTPLIEAYRALCSALDRKKEASEILNEKEDEEFQPYMDEFDGVIMWTWKESDVPLIPEKFELFKKYTPNTRRMVGCYLYNFGESKQATGEAVKWQLDYYRELLLKGEIEGVVLHTNTMADLDYEAYDVAVQWMEEHGDEEI